MIRLAFLIGWFCLVAGCGAPGPAPVSQTDRPMRIVSLDYCADQFVLKLADADQILAVSPDAVSDFSYMREAAAGVPTVRPVAEDVLVLRPDLIVRSYGGGPNAAGFFEQAGIPVLQVGWATAIDGESAGAIPSLIADAASGLGQAERGAALVADYRTRLAAIQKREAGETALYMTAAGATTGAGSLVHDMLMASGLENYQTEPGWRSLPLERLAYEQPDMVAAAFFGNRSTSQNTWTSARHPLAEAQLTEDKLVPLDGSWTTCGGWFVMDAIEALVAGPTP
ncbi:MAG: ABC transporter substrate-binding protein [Henriciella sp.]|nr:ABC transporter substrate-binding protein [Henriciella sp.]